MALRKIYLGSFGPFLYDDAEPIDDVDGDFAGEDYNALITDGPVKVGSAPITAEDVLRLEDINDVVLGPGSATDNAIARFNGVTGKVLQSSVVLIDDAGNLYLKLDGRKFYLGTADDASITYDGTDLIIKSDEINPSDLSIVCGANKTLKLQTVVYDDLYFEIAPKTTGAGKPTLASFSGNIKQYQMAINDITELRPTELVHRWKEGTIIELHVHWGSNGVDGTNRGIKWEIDYTWANSESFTGTTAFATATTLSTETQIPASTPDKTNLYTGVLSFVPTGGKVGAILLMSLKRIASVTDPTPASDPWVFMVGVHFQIDTMGSRQEGAK